MKKCPYCDFYSTVRISLVPEYLDCLKKEIRFRRCPRARIKSVYFGGGTPSVLEARKIGQILEAVERNFNVDSDAEITLEANPGTIGTNYMKQVRRAGINRISIGVQSFNDEKLKFLGRIHTADQAVDAINHAQASGFDSVSLDLIYALPSETPDEWQADLEKAVDTGANHVSCYILTLEPSTVMGLRVRKGVLSPCEPETVHSMFIQTSVFLTGSGYEHYEISSFAKGQQFRSRHNSSYWNMTPYAGFGPGAHSYDRDSRFWNRSSLGAYIRDINAGILPSSGMERLEPEQKMLETVMLGLRTCQGIDLEEFAAEFGTSFTSKFHDLVLTISGQSMGFIRNGRFCLSLEGMACLDSIVEAFAEKILQPLPRS